MELAVPLKINSQLWLSSTRESTRDGGKFLSVERKKGGSPMKKLFVFILASLTVLSLGACAGKSPKAPPPIITKG
jgi:hypothetical protein